MIAILKSRHWSYRILRIGLLVGAGWWLLNSTGLVQAQLPNEWEWPNTNFDNRTVELSEIMSGGPPKDGIPAVDNPSFVSVSQASAWLNDQEPVIAVTVGDEARAYPIQILMYHEIVNDSLAGKPLTVTFCPLCNASIVFDRRVGGDILDFGTTGRLRKSDLVMYDRQTESWWQQFTGTGIVGDHSGTELKRHPANIVAFGDFKTAYPSAEVLSRETGHSRPYGRNPYRGYDSITDQPFLFRDPVDPRLPPMEYVLNVSINDRDRLYPFSMLEQAPVVNDEMEGVPVVIFSRHGTFSALDGSSIVGSRLMPSATAFERRLAGEVLSFSLSEGHIVDDQTGSRWDLLGNAVAGPYKGARLTPANSGVHFAFAWLAFNPDSEIYGQ